MPTSSKKILIVEDDKRYRRVLVEGFKADGFEVLEAQNGKKGLARALKERPDLILLDMMMPKMNGPEMLEKVREDEWGKTVPVIALTSLEDVNGGLVWRMGELSTTEYLVKTNVTIKEVVEKVKEALEVV